MIKGKNSCLLPSFGPSLGNKFPKELVANNLSARTVLFRSSVPLEFFRWWRNGQGCGKVQNILPEEVPSVVGVCRIGVQVVFLDIVHYGQGLLEFNSDGSEAEQCGNGVRCVAQYLAGIEKNAKSFTLMSPAGLVSARVYEDGLVEVSMGVPNFEPSNIPFVASKNQLSYELIVDNKTIEINVLSMGNPHAVLQVDDINIAPVSQIGPLIEIHERFPERTNVGFMHITDKANIELRVHERGAGETAACGTGACAAVVSGQRLGLLDKEVSVQLPGGQVVVSWLGSDAPVWLKGNAVLIEEGTMNL